MKITRLGALVIKLGLVPAAATGLATTISGAKADTISIGWSSSLGGTVTQLATSSSGIASASGAIGGTSFTTSSSGLVSPLLSSGIAQQQFHQRVERDWGRDFYLGYGFQHPLPL